MSRLMAFFWAPSCFSLLSVRENYFTPWGLTPYRGVSNINRETDSLGIHSLNENLRVYTRLLGASSVQGRALCNGAICSLGVDSAEDIG